VSEHRIHLGILAGAIALAGWLFLRLGAPAPHVTAAPERESPLSIVPPGSAFVLSADIVALRRSSVGPLLASCINQLVGDNANWSKLCDFDPLSALDQVALAVPSAGEVPPEGDQDFGVIATGRFSASQIVRCASAAIAARGGDPVSSNIGHFSSVRDRLREAGEIAARDGGPLIVSGGTYFRALLDAAEGNAPKLEHQDARDARHTELRRQLGPGALVATWLLGAHWFERIAGDDAGLSPLRNLTSIGARVDFARTSRALILLECTDATSASAIADLLEKLRPTLSALPLDPRLASIARRVAITPRDRRLRLELELSEDELRALLDQARSDGTVRPMPTPGSAAPDPAPPISPR